jgi:hypothetical protein
MKLATGAIALALGAGASTIPVTTLPRPGFPGPAAKPGGPHRLALVSSRYLAPGLGGVVRKTEAPRLFGGLELVGGTGPLAFYGKDGASARVVLAPNRYAFDLASYVWPPRIRPGDKEFVYEQVVWAHEANGVLYVENAHSTYSSSSYGRNAYVTAIDLKTQKKLWRSPALVANARTFLVTGRYLITGYGFTNELDYLYLLDRASGRVVDRLDLPTGPERITWQGRDVKVRTYDHVVVARLRGA